MEVSRICRHPPVLLVVVALDVIIFSVKQSAGRFEVTVGVASVTRRNPAVMWVATAVASAQVGRSAAVSAVSINSVGRATRRPLVRHPDAVPPVAGVVAVSKATLSSSVVPARTEVATRFPTDTYAFFSLAPAAAGDVLACWVSVVMVVAASMIREHSTARGTAAMAGPAVGTKRPTAVSTAMAWGRAYDDDWSLLSFTLAAGGVMVTVVAGSMEQSGRRSVNGT